MLEQFHVAIDNARMAWKKYVIHHKYFSGMYHYWCIVCASQSLRNDIHIIKWDEMIDNTIVLLHLPDSTSQKLKPVAPTPNPC